MTVYIRVEEGPQWLVSSLEVEGVSEASRPAVDGLVQSSAGQPFSDLNVSVDRDNVLDFYYNRGVRASHLPVELHGLRAAPGGAQIQRGRRPAAFRARRAHLGAGGHRPPRWCGNASHSSRTPRYRGARLLETQRRLYDLGHLRPRGYGASEPAGAGTGQVRAARSGRSPQVYVHPAAWERKSRRSAAAARVWIFRRAAPASVPRAYFGVTRRNFLGDGHILSFQSRASTIEQRAVLSYQAPQFRGSANVNLLFSGLFDDSRDVNTFTAHRREGSVQVGQKLSKASTMLYRFSYRRVTTADVLITPRADSVLRAAGAHRHAVVQLHSGSSRRSGGRAPRHLQHGGFRRGGPRVRIADFVFSHFLGHNSTYYPMGLGSRFVLARSLTFGWLQQFGNQPIPLPERLFGGGAGSDRAFAEKPGRPARSGNGLSGGRQRGAVQSGGVPLSADWGQPARCTVRGMPGTCIRA